MLQTPGESIVAGMETRNAGPQDGCTVEVEQVGLALDPAVEFVRHTPDRPGMFRNRCLQVCVHGPVMVSAKGHAVARIVVASDIERDDMGCLGQDCAVVEESP